VLEAHLGRIEATDPSVNAIVTLSPERALDDASWSDDAIAADKLLGPLHGLSIAHKDLVATAGIRTTAGSSIFCDEAPRRRRSARRPEPRRRGGAARKDEHA
jgi:amidase